MEKETVCLITGCSTGFGRALATECLSRGFRVIATARASSIASLESLQQAGAHILELDVSKEPEYLKQKIEEAIAIYGKIDILFNNAAILWRGLVEETSPSDIMAHYHTNLFSIFWLTQAILPHFRSRANLPGKRIICNVGSQGAALALPGLGAYTSGKSALRSLSLTLNEEVRGFNIAVCVLELGQFRTTIFGREDYTPNPTAKATSSRYIEDYHSIREDSKKFLREANGQQPGDPAKGAAITLDMLLGTGVASLRKTKFEPGKYEVPEYVPLGSDVPGNISAMAQRELGWLEEFQAIRDLTEFS